MDLEPRISTDSTQIDPSLISGAKLLEEELTSKIIGAAFEVHRQLGSGFLEKVYETALLYELRLLGLKSEPQASIQVFYKSVPVGLYYADVLVERKVICEIKTVDGLNAVHEAQLLHYLKATGIKVGLLLNFRSRRCQFKRLVF